MIRALLLTLTLALAVTVAEDSFAQGTPADYPAGTMSSGIIDSRHNLGRFGVHYRADNSDGNGGTTEICIFCHTPHHGATHAPLWSKGNQTLSSAGASTHPTTYTAYGTTIGGSNIAGGDIGAATLACLSCHDGLNTFDILANAPGYGNGGTNNVEATDFMWTFTEDGDTKFDFMSSMRLNIGTDLTNDHPVSIPYTYGRASLRPTSTIISTIIITSKELSASNASDADSRTTTANRWSVLGYINANASISDLLRGATNTVECSSCHDPHFSNKSWSEVNSTWGGSNDSDGLFLRRVGGNSVSGVCRTCHNK